MSDGIARAKSIFLSAIEDHQPDQWPAFLDQACAGDAPLRAQVESLLQAHADLGTFHEKPGAGMPVTRELSSLVEQPGTTIGRYKLLERIGEGGMGVVYMAEQREPVRRKVALKIVKPGMDTREVVTRFEAERQALAMMDHPGIAHVFDGGTTESGRPYFVMELVQALPISDYCDEAGLTTRQRLELFVLVCRAVQHAHQKGIIHRDLKPSNVLVTLHDGVAVPKIIDFGIAKATHQPLTEKTLFTGHGRMMGTPMYMSPEQAEMSGLDVDTRSDIYSLGVLLYELLTGSTPFDQERLRQAGLDEVRRAICQEDPPPPSQRLTTLSAETLSTITARRGVDVRRLGRLLRGNLDWIVMKALQKDRTRRYESASALAADVERYLANEPVEARPPTMFDRVAKWIRRHRTVVWATGAALVAVIAILAASSLLLLAAYDEQSRAQAVAAANAAEAKENAAKAQVNYEKAREAVRQMLTRVANEELAKIPEMKEVRRRLFEDAIAFYTELLKLNPRDPRAYFERGYVFDLLQQYDEVRSDYEMAVQLDPNDAEFHKTLARHYFACRDPAYHDLQRARLHMDWAIRLDPKNALYHYEAARVHKVLGEKGKSIAEMRTAAELSESDPDRHMLYMAYSCDYSGDPHGAVDWAKKLTAIQPCFYTYGYLGQFYLELGEYENSIAAYTESLRLFREQHKQSDAVVVDFTYLCRGDAYAALGMYREALADYDVAIEVNPFRPGHYKRRAKAHFYFNNFEKALADVAKTLEIDPRDFYILTSIPPDQVATCPDERLRKGLLELADKAIEKTGGAADVFECRAVLHAAFGEPEKAVSDYTEALRLNPKDSEIYLARGELHRDRKDTDKAVADYEKALELLDKQAADHAQNTRISVSLQSTCSICGERLQEAGRLEAAENAFRKAVVMSESLTSRCPGWDYVWFQYVDSYGRLARLLRSTGRMEEAESLLQAMKEPVLASVYSRRAAMFRQMGNLDRALADNDAAVQLDAKNPRSFSERGETYSLMSEQEKAIADFGEAIRLAPTEPWVYERRAEFYFAVGEDEKAEADMKRWESLGPVSSHFYKRWGLAQFHLGHYDAALSHIATAVELNPGDGSALTWIPPKEVAACPDERLRKGLLELADKAIEKTGGAAGVFKCRAVLHGAFGQTEKAMADFAKAIELEPAEPDTWLCRGKYHRDRGKFQAALADYSEAIRLDPKKSVAYANRGVTYYRMGNPERAIADDTEALRLDPKDAAAYSNRALAHEAAGNLDKAIADHNEALRLDPKNAVAYNNRACIYIDTGEFDKAIADLTEAIRINPTGTSYANRAEATERRGGDLSGVVADLTKAIELEPEAAGRWFQRARLHLATGRGDEYRNECAEMLRHFALTEEPENARLVAWASALVPDVTADGTKVVNLAEKAVQSDPKSTAYVTTLGAVLYRTGRFEEAHACLAEADALMKEPSESLPLSPACTWFFLAMAEHRLGHSREAKEWLDKANAWTDTTIREAEHGATAVSSARRLTFKLLRAEVEGLLEPRLLPPSSDPAAEEKEKRKDESKGES